MRFARRDGFIASWRTFVATRLAVIAIGFLAVYTIGMPREARGLSISDSQLVNLPLRWDAGWYLNIARIGYMWTPRDAGRQQNIAFFPAFPMAMRVLGYVFGRSGLAYLYAGVLISHVAFLVALVLLFELAREELGDRSGAAAAVVLLATYPFSVFHGAVYTESLYLLGVLGAMLSMKHRHWGRAALWGLLVGLTRPNGFILSATLGVLLLETAWDTSRTALTTFWRSIPMPAVLAVAAPIVGAAVYCLFIWQFTGNPLQWSEQHAAWGRTYKGLSPFTAAAEYTAEYGVESYIEALPYDFINAIPTVCALALSIPVGRRFGWAYTVFILTNLVPPLLVGGLMSTGRLTATLFPIFIWLGGTARSSTPTIVMVFAMLQSLVAALFYTWRPLF
jgi:hypothetical protein